MKIEEVPFWLKLFKMVDTNDNLEWVITNKLAEDFTRLRAIQAVQVRWQVEEFHRSFKQSTGSEKMPMSQGAFTKESLSLLLCGVGCIED